LVTLVWNEGEDGELLDSGVVALNLLVFLFTNNSAAHVSGNNPSSTFRFSMLFWRLKPYIKKNDYFH
jgi:hypothetical protein